MDTIPYKFVESVVELLENNSLWFLRNAANGHWQDIAQLHITNRHYVRIHLISTEDGFSYTFYNYDRKQTLQLSEVAKLAPQYIRFTGISDDTGDQLEHSENRLLKCKAKDARMLFKEISLRYAREHYLGLLLNNTGSSPEFKKLIMRSLFQSVYFTKLNLFHVDAEAAAFLKDHIDNHPGLSSIVLNGDWPQSILDDIQRFCLQTEMKKEVSLLTDRVLVDNDYVKRFFDFWKANRDFECYLSYKHGEDERKTLDTMTKIKRYVGNYFRFDSDDSGDDDHDTQYFEDQYIDSDSEEDDDSEVQYYLQHETQKSMAILQRVETTTLLTITKCTCGTLHSCALKRHYKCVHKKMF